jgi:hypothetical protein
MKSTHKGKGESTSSSDGTETGANIIKKIKIK